MDTVGVQLACHANGFLNLQQPLQPEVAGRHLFTYDQDHTSACNDSILNNA